MKHSVVLCYFKRHMKAYFSSIVLGVLFFQVHAYGSQDFMQDMPMQSDGSVYVTKGSPNDGSNINREKINALSQQVIALTEIINTDFSGTFTTLANLQSTSSCDLNNALTAIAGLQSDLDVCCLDLNSKVDVLSDTVITDFNGTFTALNEINNTVNFIELALNELTASNLDQLVNTFSALIIVADDLLGTLTQLEETAIFITNTLGSLESLLKSLDSGIETLASQIDQGFTSLGSDLDVCCTELNSKIDSVSTLVTNDFNHTMTVLAGMSSMITTDFNNTYTAIAAIPAQSISGLAALGALITTGFNHTYTAIAEVQTDLNTCCATLGNKIDAITTSSGSCDLAGTYTAIAALQTDLNACCVTLGNKIDAITTSSGSCDLAGTYTVLASLQNDLNACCVLLESKIDAISTSTASCDFNGTYTMLAALEVCCLTLNSKVDALSTLVTNDFNHTFTAIAGVQNLLGSKIDVLSNIVIADFNGTFTAIAAIPATNLAGTYTSIAALRSDLDVCCLTLNSKVDALSTVVINDFNHTFTAIAGAQNLLGSKIDVLSNVVVTDFNGTFTAIAAIPVTNLAGTYTAISGLQSDLDVCCLTLNSKIDSLRSLVVTDFNNTYTAIAGTQNVLGSKIDVLSNVVVTDFNGTFTAIAAIPATNLAGTYTAISGLQSDLDVCCLTLNSKVDALSTVVTNDFNHTFTALAAISTLIANDFNSTMTALNACCTSIVSTLTNSNLCSPIVITSPTTITTPGIYCVANSISSDIDGIIIIASSNVVLDLNGYTINATAGNAIVIDSSAIRSSIIIKNGFIDGTGGGVSGVNIVGLDPVYEFQLLNTDLSNFGFAGAIFSNLHNARIEYCNFNQNNTNVGTSGANFNFCSNIEVKNCSFIGNDLHGVIDEGTASTNLRFVDCVFNNNGTNGVYFGVSSCVEFIACQANGNLSNGFTFTFVGANSVNDINLQDCTACGNAATGFVVTTSAGTSSELTGCFAQHNITGFNMAGSLGSGLIQNNKAVNNSSCGFKDNTFSLYQYVGNVGQRNDGTPAVASGDSNYCWADLAITSTMIAPSGPGFAPYYQNGRNTNGAMFGISSWDNVTLQ